MSFEEQIRERAYHIWLDGGMADGRAHEHWVCAEQALRGQRTPSAEPVVIITKAAPKPRKVAAKPVAKAVKAKAANTNDAKSAAKPAAKLAAKLAAKPKAAKAGVAQAQATTH